VDDPGVSHGAAACAAFWVLGPEAGSAVPELSRIANNANAPEAAVYAAYALGCIGSDGFGPLLAVLSDPSLTAASHARAAWELGRRQVVGTNGSRAVPLLIKTLSDPDAFVSINAASALGNLGLEPQIAVPALIDTLTRGSVAQRKFAAMALEMFGPRAKEAVPALLKMAESPYGMREAATNALRQIAPEVLKSVTSRNIRGSD
jgi:HEAT repeat protein